MMSDIFISPHCGLLLEVLAAEGGFLSKIDTGNIAPTQCAIHLCIFSFAEETLVPEETNWRKNCGVVDIMS